MQRHEADFDGEGGEESQEEPDALGVAARRLFMICRQIEGEARVWPGVLLVNDAQRDDAHQHEQAAHGGVEHKLDSGVDAARAAPTADQEIGRDEHHFPEDIEQKQIRREEDAQHACLQQQHQRHIFFGAAGDAPERRANARRWSSVWSAGRKDADAIDADAVADAEVGNPVGDGFRVLKAGLSAIELGNQT